MYRLAAVLLPCALGAALVAAPAPQSRADKPWLVGWDEPVDPVGGCRFDKKGDRLTMSVPGKGTLLDLLAGQANAPRLVRDAEGDFAVQVRVSGDFESESRTAGIVLVAEKKLIRLVRFDLPVRGRGNDLPRTESVRLLGAGLNDGCEGPPFEQPVRLRLERRGDLLRASYGGSGEECKTLVTREVKLPRKLKVGVIVEATGTGSFEVTFDQFQLTPLGGKIR